MSDGEKSALRVRLWPGVAAVIVLWVVRFGVPGVVPDGMMVAILGELVGGLAVLVWWAFFSRWPHLERWGALLLIALAYAATRRILDPSIATGMMGMTFFAYAVPVVSLGLVVASVAAHRMAAGPRRATVAAILVASCGVFALLRTEGVISFGSQFAWRWAKTSEEKLLAQVAAEPAPPPVSELPAPADARETPAPTVGAPPPSSLPSAADAARTGAGWPGFRGPHRDGVVAGLRILTDWNASPPVKLWSRRVGPGWSSFAVGDGLIYTQEQRGAFEAVTCYNAITGQPVWTHRDSARFWESNGGPGPRGTPTLHNGRVYAFGATGILNALDARTGAVVWKRNAAVDTGVKVPTWAFASSPLVLNDMVVIAVAGKLAAYDLATGNPRWTGPDGGVSYSSPALLTIDGVPQIVLLSDNGATSVAPANGNVLWKHAWRSSSILQPAITADGSVLISALVDAGGIGTRRLAVKNEPGGWTAKETWTSAGLKPYFNDFVVHKGNAYGFDGTILACIDLQDGKRKWKGGRYGNGQLVLLSDQDLLLVVSEEGELALLSATPDRFTEIAKRPGIDGKTWNHPAVAGEILFVRNGEEMAAFRLPVRRT
jgi:outer membrane protein assembly factor BamB